MSDTTVTIDHVRQVLRAAVATEAGLSPAAVPTDRPFPELGLDSMAALAVGMELEDRLGLSDLPATLLWDHPTVDALSVALWRMLADEPVTVTEGGR